MKHLLYLLLFITTAASAQRCCPCRTPGSTPVGECPTLLTLTEDPDPRAVGNFVMWDNAPDRMITVGDIITSDLSDAFFTEDCDNPTYTPTINTESNATFTLVGSTLSVTLGLPEFITLQSAVLPIQTTPIGSIFESSPNIQEAEPFLFEVELCCEDPGLSCDPDDLCEVAPSILRYLDFDCPTGIVSEIVSQTGINATIDPNTGEITLDNFTDCEYEINYRATCDNVASDIETLSGRPDLLDLNNSVITRFVAVGEQALVDVTAEVIENVPNVCGAPVYSVFVHEHATSTNPDDHIVSLDQLTNGGLLVTGVQQGALFNRDLDRIIVQVCCTSCPDVTCEEVRVEFIVTP